MISVIIPTLNEEKHLPSTLAAICGQLGSFEVIVSDGQSEDRTCHIAQQFDRVTVICGSPGRGRQMNRGARQATGEFLLFLHADTMLPAGTIQQLESLEAETSCLAGGFHHRFDDSHWALRLLSGLHNVRTRSSHLFYGDQAVFVRRKLFWEMAGYKETAVLEDVDFGARLLKRTRPFFMKDYVTVSARKFRAMGIANAVLYALTIFIAYNWFPKGVGEKALFFRPYR